MSAPNATSLSVPFIVTPLGPPHPCRDPVRAGEKGRSERWMKDRVKKPGLALKRFSWEAVDDGGQITFARAR